MPRSVEWIVCVVAVAVLIAGGGLLGWACVKWWQVWPASAWGWALLVVPLGWGVYRLVRQEDRPSGTR